MQRTEKRDLRIGLGLTAGFGIWTLLICRIDVRPVGPKGSSVGFSAFNTWFHGITGVHMGLYTVTDWLGLVPILVCMGFGVLGLMQWIRRKSLRRVDPDILLLGLYYLLVIAAYLFFEMVPVNYRPVLIDGILEASYPSSTTLLVLSVMPTLAFQAGRRAGNTGTKNAAVIFSAVFSAFMVIGRLVSGVHWATDIIGSVLLSAGLFMLYRSAVKLADRKKTGKAGEEHSHGV